MSGLRSESKLFGTLMVFMKELFEKNQQMTIEVRKITHHGRSFIGTLSFGMYLDFMVLEGAVKLLTLGSSWLSCSENRREKLHLLMNEMIGIIYDG